MTKSPHIVTTAREGRKESAMRNNDVRLNGHLGRDPQVFPNGEAGKVAKFSVATNRRWRDAAGELQEATDWVPVTAFGKLAELVEARLSKGSAVAIDGRIRTSRFERDGDTVYNTEVVAERIFPGRFEALEDDE